MAEFKDSAVSPVVAQKVRVDGGATLVADAGIKAVESATKIIKKRDKVRTDEQTLDLSTKLYTASADEEWDTLSADDLTAKRDALIEQSRTYYPNMKDTVSENTVTKMLNPYIRKAGLRETAQLEKSKKANRIKNDNAMFNSLNTEATNGIVAGKGDETFKGIQASPEYKKLSWDKKIQLTNNFNTALFSGKAKSLLKGMTKAEQDIMIPNIIKSMALDKNGKARNDIDVSKIKEAIVKQTVANEKAINSNKDKATATINRLNGEVLKTDLLNPKQLYDFTEAMNDVAISNRYYGTKGIPYINAKLQRQYKSVVDMGELDKEYTEGFTEVDGKVYGFSLVEDGSFGIGKPIQTPLNEKDTEAFMLDRRRRVTHNTNTNGDALYSILDANGKVKTDNLVKRYEKDRMVVLTKADITTYKENSSVFFNQLWELPKDEQTRLTKKIWGDSNGNLPADILAKQFASGINLNQEAIKGNEDTVRNYKETDPVLYKELKGDLSSDTMEEVAEDMDIMLPRGTDLSAIRYLYNTTILADAINGSQRSREEVLRSLVIPNNSIRVNGIEISSPADKDPVVVKENVKRDVLTVLLWSGEVTKNELIAGIPSPGFSRVVRIEVGDKERMQSNDAIKRMYDNVDLIPTNIPNVFRVQYKGYPVKDKDTNVPFTIDLTKDNKNKLATDLLKDFK